MAEMEDKNHRSSSLPRGGTYPWFPQLNLVKPRYRRTVCTGMQQPRKALLQGRLELRHKFTGRTTGSTGSVSPCIVRCRPNAVGSKATIPRHLSSSGLFLLVNTCCFASHCIARVARPTAALLVPISLYLPPFQLLLFSASTCKRTDALARS